MDTAWRNWGEQVVKAINALTGRLNEHTVTLPGLQADVAVLIDAVLRKDAEADALRAWIAELETRIDNVEAMAGYNAIYETTIKAGFRSDTLPVFKLETTTEGTADGNDAKL